MLALYELTLLCFLRALLPLLREAEYVYKYRDKSSEMIYQDTMYMYVQFDISIFDSIHNKLFMKYNINEKFQKRGVVEVNFCVKSFTVAEEDMLYVERKTYAGNTEAQFNCLNIIFNTQFILYNDIPSHLTPTTPYMEL